MNKLYLLILTSLLYTTFPFANAFGQSEIMLRGKIVNDSLEGAYLHIMNLNLQRGTITNDEGAFSIPVRQKDTLYISSLQFEPQRIPVTSAIIDQKYIEISLESAVNELETVTVKDINLSGDLGRDLGSVALTPYFDQTHVGFAPTAEKRSREFKELQVSQADFGVGAVIDILSGRRKMLKRNLQISEMERRIKAAQNLFKPDFYTEVLKLPETMIDDFAYFIYENNEEVLQLAETEQVLELVEYLKKRLPEYRKLKDLE